MDHVFLSGSHEDNSNWRKHFNTLVDGHNFLKGKIRGIDPFIRDIDESNPTYIFGRDCFGIMRAKLVVVNADNSPITTGTAQEMVIAKFFQKPVICIAGSDSFHKNPVKIIKGKEIKNWTHPFVATMTDYFADNIEKTLELISLFYENADQFGPIKKLDYVLMRSITTYLEEVYPEDLEMQKLFPKPITDFFKKKE